MLTKPELTMTLNGKLTEAIADARTLTLTGGYMAEYNEIKDRLNRRIEDEGREILNYVLAFRDIPPYKYEFQTVRGEFDTPYGAYQLVSCVKKLTKLVSRLQKSKSPWAEVMENVLAHYVRDGYYDTIVAFVAAKSQMKTGRKPSNPSDRITKERTLDNTGTCPICGKNVKLEANGTLYAHGYTIHWGGRNGNCFGVGYEPIEVSSECLVDYLKLLKEILVQKEQSLASGAPESFDYELRRNVTIKVTAQTDPKEIRFQTSYDQLCRSWQYRIESDIRMLTHEVKTVTQAIETWAPRPLPGEKGK